MKRTFITALLFLSITAYAQDEKTMIARGVSISETKTKFKVTITVKSIFDQVVAQYMSCGCIHYTMYFQKDRHGIYPEWTIYFPPEKRDEVIAVLRNVKGVSLDY